MISVTCLNGEHFPVDADLIERVESRPDTTVFLVDGAHYVVAESVDHVLRAVRGHRAALLVAAQRMERGGTPALTRHRDGELITRGHTRGVLVPARSAR